MAAPPREQLIESIQGCIIGGAIGDAAGSAFEGGPNVSTDEIWNTPDWRLTDDTQLTLATCEAIIECGRPDPAAIAAAMLRWFRARRVTGLGASTLKALRDLDAGAHWALAGRRGDRAAGNGAAMRIAPLAFCLDLRQEESRQIIRDVCRITHHHDEAYAGALAVILAIQAAMKGEWSVEQIAAELPDSSVRDRLVAFGALPKGTTIADAARRYRVSGYVAESVPFALFAASRIDEHGFTGLLTQVISAGGDTDTNAALAGQVAGSRLGLGGLPKELVARIPEAENVLKIAHELATAIAGG